MRFQAKVRPDLPVVKNAYCEMQDPTMTFDKPKAKNAC